MDVGREFVVVETVLCELPRELTCGRPRRARMARTLWQQKSPDSVAVALGGAPSHCETCSVVGVMFGQGVRLRCPDGDTAW